MKKIYLVFSLFLSIAAFAQPTVGFQPVITGLTEAVDLVRPGDTTTRLFIVEQPGKIKIWTGTSILATPFLDAASFISYGGERGLLSLAFHPGYATNRYFFIYYTNTGGSVEVARYQTKTTNPNEADPTSRVVLITIPKLYSNHNGGKLNFGPDGYLYFGTGDGGSGGDPENNAQNGTSLLGKMLRLDVNNFTTGSYSIPATNPYFGSGSVRNEVLALGLRNPFRWSFDRQTGDMWIADVGQNLYEEVDIKTAATLVSPTNYGWRCYEGANVYTTCSPQIPVNNVMPIFEYGHNSTNGGYSITGGYVYRGTEYPSLQGYYLCNDYVTNKGWLIKPNGSGGWASTLQNTWANSIVGYGEAADGTLYAVSLNGIVYKVTATPAVLPIKLISFTGSKKENQYQLKWEVLQEQNGDSYQLEQSQNADGNFVAIQTIKVVEDKKTNNYAVSVAAPANSSFFRLKVINNNGVVNYSSVIGFNNQNVKAEVRAFKTTSGNIQVTSNQALKQIMLADITGRVLYSKVVNGMGSFSIPANSTGSGIAIINIILESGARQVIKLFH